jgi:hypothetical protein
MTTEQAKKLRKHTWVSVRTDKGVRAACIEKRTAKGFIGTLASCTMAANGSIKFHTIEFTAADIVEVA